ncbi:MAG: hypothetical protein V1709_03400 [Planctomycetota bacterium]
MSLWDKIDGSMLVVLIGVIVGWLLTEISSFLRLHREDKRKLNEALSNLMDVYFYASKSNKIKLVLDAYMTHVLQDFSESQRSPAILKELRTKITLYITSITTRITKSGLDDIKNRYECSINDIAQINPILSYTLRGQTNKYDIFKEMENYISFIETDIVSSDEMAEYERMKSAVENTIVDLWLVDLENGLKKISWRISKFLWIQIRVFIYKQNNKSRREINAQIDRFTREVKKEYTSP